MATPAAPMPGALDNMPRLDFGAVNPDGSNAIQTQM